MIKRRTGQWRWWLRSMTYLLMATVAFAGLLGVVLTKAASPEPDPVAWANPSVMTVKRVSTAASAQNQPNLLANLDCSLVTYRLAASNSMTTGCFTPTAYGLMDSDSGTIIFNGTDEGLPLLPYSAHQVLAPWPGALDLVALDADNTGGSYISLYKNPLAALQDKRNLVLQLTGKQLTAAPELPLKDPAGQPLVVNAQTMAFSDGGSWMVIETLDGSFVRVNLATLDMTAFAPAYGSQGSPALLKSQVTVSSDGRYVAIANDIAGSLKVYDLATCSGTPDNLRPENCQAYDYWPFAASRIGGLNAIRHLRFVNDRLLSFEAGSSQPANSGIYELAPTAGISSLIDYLGLGDSYTSGEGAYDYVADTDSADNMCHLSARSYPLLLTQDLFSSLGGHSVACSGAVLKDVSSTSQDYRGQVRAVPSFQQLQQNQPALLASIMTNFAPGYVAQQRFVKQYQPGVVTVSVGGDDIGFGNIVLNCVIPHISPHLSDSDCYNTYEDRLELTNLIDRTVPRWTALYKQLMAAAPSTRLYAIGYPTVVSDKGNCALNAHLGKSEAEFSEEIIAYLDDAIKQAADKAGVSYVDISQALAGHRLCETDSYDVAVNGLTAGTDASVLGVALFGKESYHPNALGQSLIEQAILGQTHNLTGTPPAASETTSSAGLLNVPKTGRTVYALVPESNLVANVVKPAGSTILKASGTQDGLKAGASYTVRLDGSGGTVLAAVNSDGAGDISTAISLPAGTPPGEHSIDVTGENQAGEPVDVSQPIYVPASDNDSDGDGIDNAADSCPTAANSGQDSDQDGIDDSCDGFISLPPTSGTAVGGSGESGGSASTGQETVGVPLVTDVPTVMSTVLNPPIVTAVASFSEDSGLVTPLVSGESPSDTGSIAPMGRVLGSKTVNPAAVSPQSLKITPPSGRADRSKAIVPIPSPRLSGWLPWFIMAVAAWLILLLLILLLIANRPENQRRQAEYM